MSIFLACLWSQHNSIDNVHRLVKHQNTHGGLASAKQNPYNLRNVPFLLAAYSQYCSRLYGSTLTFPVPFFPTDEL